MCCCCCAFSCVACWTRLFDALATLAKANGRLNASAKVVFLSVII
ncbi:Uncharacterised protein [Vibrio cholerae]|nr:Uncharacterised protein [Vibrio cholerae]